MIIIIAILIIITIIRLLRKQVMILEHAMVSQNVQKLFLKKEIW